MGAADGQAAAMKTEAAVSSMCRLSRTLGHKLMRRVQNLQASIAGASSKDEALELAIQAAELCMKALRIATDREQKSDIKSQCQTLLSEAERIKTVNQWPLAPAATRSPVGSRDTSSLTLHAEPAAIEAPSAARPKQLNEPILSRKISKAEQIILLKSSKLNGFAFPPWHRPPDPSEFILGSEQEPFR